MVSSIVVAYWSYKVLQDSRYLPTPLECSRCEDRRISDTSPFSNQNAAWDKTSSINNMESLRWWEDMVHIGPWLITVWLYKHDFYEQCTDVDN
jgi:hypothetical protein